MKLSTIRATLAEQGLQPTRSLGQNFLHDQNLAEWIVGQLDLQPGEAWVEIGPGLGALTEFALRQSPHGLLIEKDDRLVPYLRERFAKLQIVHGDAATFDVRELFARGPVKVFGNLPYYVSSQILFNFLGEPSPAQTLIFTLQKELAQRLAAQPGTKDYGAPTLLIGRRWRTQYLRTLPPSVFTPIPQVESAVVKLTPRDHGEVPDCDGALFERLVKLGFSQRRKQLRKRIAGALPRWSEALASLESSGNHARRGDDFAAVDRTDQLSQPRISRRRHARTDRDSWRRMSMARSSMWWMKRIGPSVLPPATKSTPSNCGIGPCISSSSIRPATSFFSGARAGRMCTRCSGIRAPRDT